MSDTERLGDMECVNDTECVSDTERVRDIVWNRMRLPYWHLAYMLTLCVAHDIIVNMFALDICVRRQQTSMGLDWDDSD